MAENLTVVTRDYSLFENPVTVDYFTSDVTAQAGSDYIPIAGTLTYQPGETNKILIVQAIGDLQPEPDETFTLTLTNVQYALISTGQVTGTILNDDIYYSAHEVKWTDVGGQIGDRLRAAD